jgi:outer membrane protein OmpA-like peptidoglycan-associated protein
VQNIQPTVPTAAAAAAATTASSMATISEDEKAVLDKPIIFGAIGETMFSELHKPDLDAVADILKKHPDIRLLIVGHICNNETETENNKVGVARAKAVANYLHSKGIDRHRLEISNQAVVDPSLPYDPAANYRNRRVVISIK